VEVCAVRGIAVNYFTKTVRTPVGALKLIASDRGLAAILWENDNPKRVPMGALVEDNDHPALKLAEGQLTEYFAGKRKSFEITLDPAGTDFQKRVWRALLEIPYGETRAYAQIANHVGNPKAVRAVGAANGKNPISIVAPCHRVIGTDGSLTGFAGGLEIKRFLLSHEASVANATALRAHPHIGS
jgi:methylated-DNA-[protein]-cysteine S-methyltransferase